jgi:hypothetical protein
MTIKGGARKGDTVGTIALTEQQLAEDLRALDDAEARHLREGPQRRAAGGGSTLRVPAGFTAGDAFQAAGKVLTCGCGFSVTVIPDAGRFAVLLSSDDERTPPHTLGTRELADRAALMTAARHGETCKG